MLTLRSSPASPFGRKVKIAASLLDLIDRIEVVEADTSNPDDSLRQQNPLGKIPTLVLENGETLYDSRVILEYLDDLAGGGHIYPSGWDRFAALASAGARGRHHGCGVDPGLRDHAGARKKSASRNGSITTPARSRAGSIMPRPISARRRRPSMWVTSRRPARSAISICGWAGAGARRIRGSSPGCADFEARVPMFGKTAVKP